MIPFIDHLRLLRRHEAWADEAILDALRAAAPAPAEAMRELAHILGAEETWLARIEGRPSMVPIWPEVAADPAAALDALVALEAAVRAGYDTLLARLDDGRLQESITYTNSAGRTFTNTVGDILMHVALHAQYHRGKINLLLRQTGAAPAPVDFISFVRGAPAATTRPA